ncbi:hypothetical protein U1Q18_046642 [Sarracenia purpurea var. burkii]
MEELSGGSLVLLLFFLRPLLKASAAALLESCLVSNLLEIHESRGCSMELNYKLANSSPLNYRSVVDVTDGFFIYWSLSWLFEFQSSLQFVVLYVTFVKIAN